MLKNVCTSLMSIFVGALLLISGCQSPASEPSASERPQTVHPELSREALADKTLGLLIGSAIGDAMGAPTEMWDRRQIRIHYGFIDSLDPHVREASPEGPWDMNLPAGGTTDDTRWKELVAAFLASTDPAADTLDARAFAGSILQAYQQYIDGLKATDGFRPEPYEEEARRMTWLQEWALVAKPYAEGDYEAYITALNRFYGGDMACAGLLYSPLAGIYYPGIPEIAYQEGYRLGIFDHGYARDITALAAALTAAVATPGATGEGSLEIIRGIDPYHFFESRLLGRSAHHIYRQSREIAYDTEAYEPTADEIAAARLPRGWKDSKEAFLRWEFAYQRLDDRLQDVPFHAGEIWLVTLTALQVCDWQFMPTLEFIVNFGRDNDTSAALAGAILGAYHGAAKLPENLSSTTLKVNRESLGIDLEKTAATLTEQILKRKKAS